jgi:hypothetical protein
MERLDFASTLTGPAGSKALRVHLPAARRQAAHSPMLILSTAASRISPSVSKESQGHFLFSFLGAVLNVL